MPTRNDFKPGEFCWVDLAAHDLDAAAAWYSELFGWTHMAMPGEPGARPVAGRGVAEALERLSGLASDRRRVGPPNEAVLVLEGMSARHPTLRTAMPGCWAPATVAVIWAMPGPTATICVP